jgi:hypothetical protein
VSSHHRFRILEEIPSARNQDEVTKVIEASFVAHGAASISI